ncbi:GntR family transcriptional regulator [Yinghuangia soli]|uniref:GntR family transcriptional regulator n=1 Tax=Yinghuangia soli TaxID=2908204 RepID=A0AA41U0I0_9ACTN|nr:GntR family transcriptional regulator [Yinghuangia soli]MCF2528465.1 GntR family transcriptional regulator [Yinghuangia soli]
MASAGLAQYRQLADEIRQRILAGEWKPGAALPSHKDLARETGYSVGIVQVALRELAVEGIVEGRLGSGTYVTGLTRRAVTRVMQPGGGTVAPVFEDLRETAYTHQTTTMVADRHIAQRLAVDIGADVMRTTYECTAGGRTYALVTSWEPLYLTAGTPIAFPEQGPFAGQGVLARFAAIGLPAIRVNEDLIPRAVTTQEARVLNIARSALVTVVERTVFGARHPLEAADTLLPVGVVQPHYITRPNG